MSKVKELLKEKILIKQDNKAFDVIMSDLEKWKPVLEEVKSAFEGLQIGEFDNTRFLELVNENTDHSENLFKESLEVQLDALKINSKVLRENMIRGNDKVIARLLKAVKEMKMFVPLRSVSYRLIAMLRLGSISYGKRGFNISKGERESIMEQSCRSYIETAEEKEIYDALIEACNGYGKFKKLIISHRYSKLYTGGMIHNLPVFLLDTDEPEPNLFAIKNFFYHNDIRLEREAKSRKAIV